MRGAQELGLVADSVRRDGSDLPADETDRLSEGP